MAADYILKEGNENVMICERGIRTFETATRFTLDLGGVAWLKLHTHLPGDRRPEPRRGRPPARRAVQPRRGRDRRRRHHRRGRRGPRGRALRRPAAALRERLRRVRPVGGRSRLARRPASGLASRAVRDRDRGWGVRRVAGAPAGRRGLGRAAGGPRGAGPSARRVRGRVAPDPLLSRAGPLVHALGAAGVRAVAGARGGDRQVAVRGRGPGLARPPRGRLGERERAGPDGGGDPGGAPGVHRRSRRALPEHPHGRPGLRPLRAGGGRHAGA